MNNILNYYVNLLQGHPSRCNSTCTFETVVDPVKELFTDKDQPLLVIGCGDGKEVFLFKEFGFTKVVGITQGQLNVEAGRTDFQLKNHEIISADMHDLGFLPVEKFAYAYMNQTWEHAFAPFVFCLELWTVMKPFGKVYIKYPSHKEEGRSKLTDPMTAVTSHHHPNMLRMEDTMSFLHATGFIINQVWYEDDNILLAEKIPLNELLKYNVHPDVKHILSKRLKDRG